MGYQKWNSLVLDWVNNCKFIGHVSRLADSDIEAFFYVFERTFQKKPMAQESPSQAPAFNVMALRIFLYEKYQGFTPELEPNGRISPRDKIYVYSLLMHYVSRTIEMSFFGKTWSNLSETHQQYFAAFVLLTLDIPKMTRNDLLLTLAKIHDLIENKISASAPSILFAPPDSFHFQRSSFGDVLFTTVPVRGGIHISRPMVLSASGRASILQSIEIVRSTIFSPRPLDESEAKILRVKLHKDWFGKTILTKLVSDYYELLSLAQNKSADMKYITKLNIQDYSDMCYYIPRSFINVCKATALKQLWAAKNEQIQQIVRQDIQISEIDPKEEQNTLAGQVDKAVPSTSVGQFSLQDMDREQLEQQMESLRTEFERSQANLLANELKWKTATARLEAELARLHAELSNKSKPLPENIKSIEQALAILEVDEAVPSTYNTDSTVELEKVSKVQMELLLKSLHSELSRSQSKFVTSKRKWEAATAGLEAEQERMRAQLSEKDKRIEDIEQTAARENAFFLEMLSSLLPFIAPSSDNVENDANDSTNNLEQLRTQLGQLLAHFENLNKKTLFFEDRYRENLQEIKELKAIVNVHESEKENRKHQLMIYDKDMQKQKEECQRIFLKLKSLAARGEGRDQKKLTKEINKLEEKHETEMEAQRSFLKDQMENLLEKLSDQTMVQMNVEHALRLANEKNAQLEHKLNQAMQETKTGRIAIEMQRQKLTEMLDEKDKQRVLQTRKKFMLLQRDQNHKFASGMGELKTLKDTHAKMEAELEKELALMHEDIETLQKKMRPNPKLSDAENDYLCICLRVGCLTSIFLQLANCKSELKDQDLIIEQMLDERRKELSAAAGNLQANGVAGKSPGI